MLNPNRPPGIRLITDSGTNTWFPLRPIEPDFLPVNEIDIRNVIHLGAETCIRITRQRWMEEGLPVDNYRMMYYRVLYNAIGATLLLLPHVRMPDPRVNLDQYGRLPPSTNSLGHLMDQEP